MSEFVALDAPAARALWGRLFDLDLQAKVETGRRPTDDRLLHLLVDSRAAAPILLDGLWLRVVDLPAALAARRYTTGVDVVLDVYLQADYEGIGFGEALGTTLTTPSLARDLFNAYFSPVDAVFWLIATTSAYRFVAAVTGLGGRRDADAGPPAQPYGPHA